MHVFEFNTKHLKFFIDLGSIQIISKLYTYEEPYTCNNGYGPGSGHMECGRAIAHFKVTLAFHTEEKAFEVKTKSCNDIKKHEQIFTEQLGRPFSMFDAASMPELALFRDYLNALPDAFEDNRLFAAEYRRLLDAWKACKSQPVLS